MKDKSMYIQRLGKNIFSVRNSLSHFISRTLNDHNISYVISSEIYLKIYPTLNYLELFQDSLINQLLINKG